MKAEIKMTRDQAEKLATQIVGLEPRFVDSTLGVVASKIAQAMREQRAFGYDSVDPSRVQKGNLGDGRYAAYRTNFVNH